MSPLNQGEKKYPPDWDNTAKSTQTREQQKLSIDDSLKLSMKHILISLCQKNTEINANHYNELQVMLRETINARKVLVESHFDACIKVLLVKKSASFLPFLISYIGIRTLVPEILKVPEILSNRPSTKNPSTSTNIQKDTTALNDDINDSINTHLDKTTTILDEIQAKLDTLLAQFPAPIHDDIPALTEDIQEITLNLIKTPLPIRNSRIASRTRLPSFAMILKPRPRPPIFLSPARSKSYAILHPLTNWKCLSHPVTRFSRVFLPLPTKEFVAQYQLF
eukprot:scaffold17564_cov59-Attheya_sp.AAC.1